VLLAAAIVLGTSGIASLYPAWKASRLDVVEALRRNR
jgi:ABC-type lipoprotein release transport system permease subunit